MYCVDDLDLAVLSFQPSCSGNSVSSVNAAPSWSMGLASQTDSIAPSSHYNPSQLYFQVCREFQRGSCTRQPSECRFAHPSENVTVDSTDNHVTVCMDFVKGKCSRDSCRYFHPPLHLQAQIKTVQQRANTTAAAAAAQGLVGLSSLLLSPVVCLCSLQCLCAKTCFAWSLSLFCHLYLTIYTAVDPAVDYLVSVIIRLYAVCIYIYIYI